MCAIAGAINVPDASYVVKIMLLALQHRGQEGAGIFSSDKDGFHEHRAPGLVEEAFRGINFAERLPGTMAIGHTRYSTAKSSAFKMECLQPMAARMSGQEVAIVHNGNLTNYEEGRAKFEELGAVYRSTSDTEHLLHLVARAKGGSFDERLQNALEDAKGAWSLLMMTPDAIYAATDPYGFRPLVAAEYKGGIVFASETCVFDMLGVRPTMSFERGVILKQTAREREVRRMPVLPAFGRACSFEHGYFSKPDSRSFGVSSHAFRKKLGIALAQSAPADVDLVTPVPDSANAMAAAYAQTLGLPFEHGLVRNHYTGRTFITPDQLAREFGVRMKFNADRDVVEGKRVAVVDDSIVRGTTTRRIAQLLRENGATEVHLRIAMPRIIAPCRWGIDTPDRDKLIAAQLSVEELARYLGVDSLAYTNVRQLMSALGDERQEKYCLTCFTDRQPEEAFDPAILAM